jgi:hypothetical protein
MVARLILATINAETIDSKSVCHSRQPAQGTYATTFK